MFKYQLKFLSMGCMLNILTGCMEVGNSTPHNANNTLQSKLSLNHEGAIEVESIDAFEIDYRLNVESQNMLFRASAPKPICSASTSYCVSFPYDSVYAYYGPSITPGLNAWSQQNFPARITISFKKDSEDLRSLKLSDVGIQTLINKTVVGDISLVNWSKCETLLQNKNIKLTGQSCAVDMIYTGREMRANMSEKINFKFATDSGDNVDYQFNAENKLASGNIFPILNSTNTGFVFNPPILDLKDNSLNISTFLPSQIQLKNVGTKDLKGESDTPTISMAVGNNYTNLFGKIYAYNRYYSSINTGDLAIKNIAYLPIYYEMAFDANGYLLSPYGVFVDTYNNGLQKVNYANQIIVSNGVIAPVIRTLNLNGGIIDLNKVNLIMESGYSGSIETQKLSGFKLYAEYNPELNITRASIDTNNYFSYSVGEYKFGVGAAEIAKNVSLSFDPKCFESGFDSYEPTSRECKVKVGYNGNLYNDIGYKKPLSLVLVAEYKSDMNGYVFKQILGTLTLTAAAVPDGEYKDSCTDYNMDASMYLSAKCKNGVGQYIDTSINYGVCLKDSKFRIENIKGFLSCYTE